MYIKSKTMYTNTNDFYFWLCLDNNISQKQIFYVYELINLIKNQLYNDRLFLNKLTNYLII